ncbi:hypothetical protein ABW20_dc0107339 [Dactylellina cionopaga]|nr:hypothetical protein ABW20_dc0107339 [Dactylellina cionopaga]
MSNRKRNISGDEEHMPREPKRAKAEHETRLKKSDHTSTCNAASYTVGWICAIQTEYVAARAFLDETHEAPDFVSTNDNNHYTLGKVGKHNVVIAVLPDGEYGTSSAASVARDILHSFPNIRIGLMVGIGGGAPSPKCDIRLGDIVVSAASRGGKAPVVQYDFGKKLQSQVFRPTGFLNQPPQLLRTAVHGIKAQYEMEGHRIEQAINSVLEKYPRMRSKYKRPNQSSDLLYKPEIIHPSENELGCATVCGDNLSSLVSRPGRTEDEDNPAIHYGRIASANQLMKDATFRDQLAAEEDVLCFEMEVAGLMNHFPCLVIRGICDYSDSHKNKEWQGYAAMTAAAYAKDLLYQIIPNNVEDKRKITEILSTVGESVDEILAHVQGTSESIKHIESEQMQEKIIRWLSPPDPSINYNKALQQRHKGSGRWFLEGKHFEEWKTRQSSFLWLYGIPGCGKTILSSTIIENLSSNQPLVYFYFDFNDNSKQTFENMIRALISQLYGQCRETSQILNSLFSSCRDGHQQPRCQSLCDVFLRMVEQVNEVWLVLDALDECSKEERRELLLWMREISISSEHKNVHLLVTSRLEKDIESGIMEFNSGDKTVPIVNDLVAGDIHSYIRSKVREGDGLKRWRSYPKVQDEIEKVLGTKANGM